MLSIPGPYPALCQTPPFEVHFERKSTDIPWGFNIKRINAKENVEAEKVHLKVWKNYLTMAPRKLDNIYLIEAIDPNEENSEIIQWNEYHAQQFNVTI